MVAVLIFGIFCTGAFAKDVFRRPLPLRAFGPRVLRWKTLRVSSAPHPCGFESHEMGPNKNGPLSRTVSNSVVGDEGCRVRLRRPHPLRRSAPRVLRWKTLRVSSAPPLAGSNPSAMGPKRKAPIAGGLVIQVVGDEGYRVRLAPPASAAALRALRAALENASRFLSSAPLRVRIPLRRAQTKTVPFRGPFPILWWAMRDSNPQPCACKAPALTVAPIARAERV